MLSETSAFFIWPIIYQYNIRNQKSKTTLLSSENLSKYSTLIGNILKIVFNEFLTSPYGLQIQITLNCALIVIRVFRCLIFMYYLSDNHFITKKMDNIYIY